MKKTKKTKQPKPIKRELVQPSVDDIKILSETKNEDGTTNLTFDVSDKFLAKYKKVTGAKVIDEKLLGKFILDLIKDAAKEIESKGPDDEDVKP